VRNQQWFDLDPLPAPDLFFASPGEVLGGGRGEGGAPGALGADFHGVRGGVIHGEGGRSVRGQAGAVAQATGCSHSAVRDPDRRREAPIAPASVEQSPAFRAPPSVLPARPPEIHPRVQLLLDSLRGSKRLSPHLLRRAMRRSGDLSSRSSAQPGLPRPDGRKPAELVQPHLFRSGTAPLPPGASPLVVDEWIACHVHACATCKPGGRLLPTCYFAAMADCLTCGWDPPITPANIKPAYAVQGNALSASHFAPALSASIAKQLACGAIEVVPIPPGACAADFGIVSPVAAILKNSDKARALAITGSPIFDQASLGRANVGLSAAGYPEVKVRAVLNVTATGINDATDKAPFRSPGFGDAIDQVYPRCWMTKTDFTNYFAGHFSLAVRARAFFMMLVAGVLYRALRCVFGFALCPLYCSAFSAEVAHWIRQDFPVSFYLDDFFAVSDPALPESLGEASARARLNHMLRIFAKVGLAVASEKTEVAQRMLVLGFWIDSTTMVISFDALAARAYAVELRGHLASLEANRHLSSEILARMGGKLISYCGALQTGLLRVRLVYRYWSAGICFSAHGRAGLIADLKWWLVRLDIWALGDPLQGSLPILSPAALLAKPGAIHTFASDASGPDGFGGFHGPLHCTDPEYFSLPWLDPKAQFRSSAQGELAPVAELLDLWTVARPPAVEVLIWITDSAAAAAIVNKGCSKSDPCHELLVHILDSAELLGIQLVALWAPREEGVFADFLSHLANDLHVPFVSGRISALFDGPASASDPGPGASIFPPQSGRGKGSRGFRVFQSGGGHVPTVLGGHPRQGPGTPAPNVPPGRQFLGRLRGAQQVRAHLAIGAGPAAARGSSPRASLAFLPRRSPDRRTRRLSASPRHFCLASEGGIPHQPLDRWLRANQPRRASTPPRGLSAGYGARRPSARRRAHGRAQSPPGYMVASAFWF
jgi:hypothetical protein